MYNSFVRASGKLRGRALALGLVGHRWVRAHVDSHPSISLRMGSARLLALGIACVEAGLVEDGLDVEALESKLQLAEIYGWVTEGFHTTDLKDARELLEELSGSP